MRSGNARVCIAFEDRGEEVAMLLTLRAPRGRKFLENSVIGESSSRKRQHVSADQTGIRSLTNF